MSDLFFYGTLRHAPLLEVVLGRPASDIDLTPATLADHAVHEVGDQIFPMIVHAPGERAEGVLVRGLGLDDIARMEFYEGGFDFDLEPRLLELPDGSKDEAQVFVPEPDLWQAGERWVFSDWAGSWGELTLHAAREVMGHYGRMTAAEIARSFGAIRVRAAARVAASRRPKDPERDVERDVIVQDHRYAYIGYFGHEEMTLKHRQHDGSMGPVLNRSALMNGQASVVLPYDPVRDRVVLIEQFRPPVYMIGDPAPWMWEAVAGMVDPGETPLDAAYREAREEAHVALRGAEYVGGAYSSSGSSSEFLHLYVGLADLTETTETGGVEHEGEDIRSRIISFNALMQMVDRHEIKNIQLLTIANWLARHRDRLRAEV
ncbi:MAG: NUDIX domain-containing protein [Ruegeria sp.]